MNKDSGGDGVPAELFQSPKEDAVEVLNQYANNLEDSSMDTGLERVNFHSNPKEGQCQKMFKLYNCTHNCTHFTCQQGNAQNLSS